jgi:hypothetical protein
MASPDPGMALLDMVSLNKAPLDIASLISEDDRSQSASLTRALTQ